LIVQKGLGTITNSSLIAEGVTAASSVSAATGATASLLAAIGIGAQAVPVVGTIIGGVALLISALGIGNGCGGTCTEATQVVNQIEPLMQQNLSAAQAQASANGGCLTSAEVSAATANWQALWNEVLSNCGQIPAPGGTQCISDRQPGGKYDWTAYYLTPIQQIPVCAVAAPVSVESDISSIANTFGLNISGSELLFYGGVGLLGLFLLSEL
jgi:hypothetical protein